MPALLLSNKSARIMSHWLTRENIIRSWRQALFQHYRSVASFFFSLLCADGKLKTHLRSTTECIRSMYLQIYIWFICQMHLETSRNSNLLFLCYRNTRQAEEKTEPPTRAKYKSFSERGLNIDNVWKTVTVVRPPAQFNTGKNKSAVLHICSFGVTFK